MNYLKQALTELLSGLTTKKNEKEIWSKNQYRVPITVEPIDDENYIVRRYYYYSEQLRWEAQYKNDQLHGVNKGWSDGGILLYEEFYENGKFVKTIK